MENRINLVKMPIRVKNVPKMCPNCVNIWGKTGHFNYHKIRMALSKLLFVLL